MRNSSFKIGGSAAKIHGRSIINPPKLAATIAALLLVFPKRKRDK
jgi:hypothetical protein